MAAKSKLPDLEDLTDIVPSPLGQASERPTEDFKCRSDNLLGDPIQDDKCWDSFCRSTFRAPFPSSPVPEVLVRATLTNVLSEISTTFRVDVSLQGENFERACKLIYEVLFQEPERAAADRKDLIRRLNAVASHAKAIQPILQSTENQAAGEKTARLALATSIYCSERGFGIALEQLEVLAQSLSHLEAHCYAAVRNVRTHNIVKGLTWYEAFTKLMISVALSVGVKVSIAGDRSGEGDEAPYSTPFTTLLFGVERLFPERARSPKLSACAKRVERTRAYRIFHDRLHSSE